MREALKMALEAFENWKHVYPDEFDEFDEDALKTIKEALAQTEQEPVAWATQMGEYAHIKWGAKRPEYPMVYEVPLYTAPPQRTWVGLTDEEELKLAHDSMGKSRHWLVAQVEAKLKEKNT